MIALVAAILLVVVAALAWLAHDAAGEQVGGKHKAGGNDVRRRFDAMAGRARERRALMPMQPDTEEHARRLLEITDAVTLHAADAAERRKP